LRVTSSRALRRDELVTRVGAKVAIINSNEDTVDMLRISLEAAGMVTVSCHVTDIKRGKIDFQDFVRQHQPEAAVYDIAPPYEENWSFFNLLRTTEVARKMKFVLTTTNRDVLLKVCGECDPIEIIGKPYDLEAVTKAVQEALGRTQSKS
jgi:CheY-like chemotaxis protein